SRARARLVLDRQLALAAEPARLRGELLLEQLHGRGAVGAQRERAARKLVVPGGDRRARGGAHANAAEQRVAACEQTRILAPRGASPLTAPRVARAPTRSSSRSLRVRGERAVQAK